MKEIILPLYITFEVWLIILSTYLYTPIDVLEYTRNN